MQFEAADTGRLTITALTIPVGPGYHTYIAGMVKRLGEEIGSRAEAAEGEDEPPRSDGCLSSPAVG